MNSRLQRRGATLARLLPADRMALFDQIGDLVLQHGPKALDALAALPQRDLAGLAGIIVDGLLAQDVAGYHLTERGLQRLERGVLDAVLEQLDPARGPSDDPARRDEPLTDRDLHAALTRVLAPGVSCPLQIEPADVNRFIVQCRQTLSVALLLDMGHSMRQFGRFHQAKRAALALQSLAAGRFADDSVDVIGFSALAEPISREKLPLAMPVPVALADRQVSIQIPIADAASVSQNFTNLQMALQLAGRTLGVRRGQNKAIFIVTDNEPSACLADGQLVLRCPPDSRTADSALAEAESLARAGIRLTSFALIDDYSQMDWVDFIDRLTRLTRGASFYCGSSDLAPCVIESYIAAKKA